MESTRTYIPLHDLGPEYRVGRCNHCRNRRVYAWHKDTGLRLDDVKCPICKWGLDRTSREAHGYRMLSDEEISSMREDAIERYKESRIQSAEVADSWIQELDLHDPSSGEYYAAELNADRYLKGAKYYANAITRLEKAAATS